MNSSRTLSAFVLTISATLAACGGGNGNGGTGGTGGGGGGGNGGGGQCLGGTCTQADQAAVNQYNSCVQDACDAQFRACYGPNFATGGAASGACGAYATCTNACGCNASSACVQACGQPSSECLSCTVTLGSCILGASSCTRPACLGESPDLDAGISLDGGFPGLDAGNHTCADLLGCCNTLSGQQQTTCLAGYNALMSSGDAACSAAYAALGCQ
jgi:hypothetical protein